MKLSIPHFDQNTDYTCGPATLQMVLTFLGKPKSQKRLTRQLKVRQAEMKLHGTNHKKLIEAALRNKLCVYANENSTIAEIKHFLKLRLPVIVNYIEPDSNEGHYSVISGYGFMRRTIIMNDPWNGKNFKLPEKEFFKRWKSGDGSNTRWILVISKKPLSFEKKSRSIKNKAARFVNKLLVKSK